MIYTGTRLEEVSVTGRKCWGQINIDGLCVGLRSGQEKSMMHDAGGWIS